MDENTYNELITKIQYYAALKYKRGSFGRILPSIEYSELLNKEGKLFEEIEHMLKKL